MSVPPRPPDMTGPVPGTEHTFGDYVFGGVVALLVLGLVIAFVVLCLQYAAWLVS